MMIPHYMRFYGQSVSQALSEYAVTFFSLINAMYRIQARENMSDLTIINAATNGGDNANKVVSELRKQEAGLTGIIKEVRNIKGK